jgi:hypothetical protein
MMITVADQDTLRARFEAIGGDWLAEKLTPKFATRAGTEFAAPEGVNMAVELALHAICDGLPAPTVAALRMSRDDIRAALAAEAPVA